ncbi:DUF4012 domain-containing protein [Patescibacteria group bacterium]|nr:DUF4012 domain-containing protein [Patescibacteria group bacterium]MBU1473195.1 DUF4012 domain-containing protein [Patescibacteria group bacterium]MBU2459755.1 DUF4012 domain-containing protein [Patescibacteria group bacterium]MBU2544267.1 DUF4012 domain-containing protein [Patescibacteria group bacterium]
MPDELKKIDVETEPSPEVTPQGSTKRHFPKKFILIPAGVLLAIIVLFLVMLLPLRAVLAKAGDVKTAGQAAAAAIKDQNLEETKTSLMSTRKSLTALSQDYQRLLPLRYVPFFGRYISDGDHAIKAGFAGLDAADKAIEALEPNSDLLGLKGGSKFVYGSADERIQTAVRTMNALTPQIEKMSQSVDTLRNEIDNINPARYPKRIGNIVIRERLAAVKDVIDSTANLFVNAQPLLMSLPSILGEPSEKRYLVLFQNDKELRSTGGFLTAYAQFRFVRGKAILEKADDMYALDAAKRTTFPAPPEILKFHKGVYTLNIRDSNLSPDYKVSMQKFEELYSLVSGREKIDGIIAVDTHVLVEALKILGPMTVYGRQFSAETDKRCDCPRAVYELEDYSTRPVGYVREARKDIIGVLLQGILQKALGVSPSQYWGKLFQMLLSEIGQKHILAYFHDEAVQKAAESFNMGGRIMTASETATLLKYKENEGWDYLHINNSNMAGAKSNMFVSEKVTKDTKINSDGTLTTSLIIDYKNPYPGSDCGLESGGLCLNAPLRDWVRIYAPLGSSLVDSKGARSPKDGKPVAMDTYESLGKTVFEGFLTVDPLGMARLELTYTTPAVLKGAPYQLLIQKQPGTDGIEYTIKLGGKERKVFPLIGDTEIAL